MPIIGTREVEIGLGIEATPGTAVASTISLKWLSSSLQSIAQKTAFGAVRGVRNETSGSIISRKYAKGALKVVADVEIAPYLFGLALGTVVTTLAETALETGTATGTSKATGTCTTNTASKVIDSAADFVTAAIAADDWIHNTTDDTWSQVATVDDLHTITADTDICPDGNEAYEIIRQTANKLIDTSANFTTASVAANDFVHNITTDTWCKVVTKDSATQLTLDEDLFASSGGHTYEVGTPVCKHTISTQNSNASMKAATVTVKEGSIVTEKYANAVVDTLTLAASKDFATIEVEVLAKFGVTGTLSPAYTDEYLLSYKDITAKFGTTITTALAGSASALKSLTFKHANNVLIDEAFLTGSNEPASGGFVAGTQTISGTYTLHFTDTTELNKYKADTKNALVVDLVGNAIGDAEHERIRIQIASLQLTKEPREYDVNGVIVLSQDFVGEYSATETKSLDIEITNENNGESY
jgi:hypothetical protein